MLWSVLALMILVASTMLILSNLRIVVQDIVQVLVASVTGARFANQLSANLAFAALWLLIFVLSYG